MRSWQGSREDGGAFPQLLFGAVGKLGLPGTLPYPSRQAGVELLQALAPESSEGPGSEGGPGQAALPEQLPPYDSPLKAFKGYRRAPAWVAVPARSTACLCYTLNSASQLFLLPVPTRMVSPAAQNSLLLICVERSSPGCPRASGCAHRTTACRGCC